MAAPDQTLALTNAITALTNAIATIGPPPAAAAARTPIHDIFASNDAFDLSTKAGMEALTAISKPLNQAWDGSTIGFPEFLVNLQLQFIKGKWNATGDLSISTVRGKDIFTKYHSITQAQVDTAQTTRTNDRAKQNAQALYRCLESSIGGSIKTTIFSQPENLPDHEDGVSLFKLITEFTAVSSIQLSSLSLSQILSFDPAEYDFNITTINTKLA